MTEKETVTAREDQPQLGTCDAMTGDNPHTQEPGCVNWRPEDQPRPTLKVFSEQAGQFSTTTGTMPLGSKSVATEAQGEAPQCPNCHLPMSDGNGCHMSVETGAHPSQEARREWAANLIRGLAGLHGESRFISEDEEITFVAKFAGGARSTPSLPSKVERELQVAHNILRQFGRYCKLPDGKCDTCLKVEAELLAAGGSAPSPDPQDSVK